MGLRGYEYSFGDMQVVLPGRTVPVDGVIAIEYGSKQEKKIIHGRGYDGVAIGKGSKDSSGSLTMLQSDFEAMCESIAGEKDPLNIPLFDITVSYAPEGGVVTTDKLIGCSFSEWKKGWK